MKSLLSMLVFSMIMVSMSGAYSRAETGEPDDPETKEELSAEHDESGDAHHGNFLSKPKAIYNYFRSHYDDGLVFESKNGNFRIRARTRVQVQFSVTDEDTNSTDTDFFLRRLRLKLDGHAFRPWLKYVLQLSRDNIKLDQLGDASGIQLKDAYIDAVYFKKIFPRVGQFKVPFNREELNSSTSLLFVERSIVNTEFAYARDRGVSLYGFLGKHIVYGAGVFGGAGIQGTEEGTAIGSNLFAGRVQLNFGGTLKYSNGSFPSGGDYKLVPDFTKVPVFELGAALVGIPDLDIRGKTPDSGALVERFDELGIVRGGVVSIAADASYKLPGYNIEASYLGRWIDPDEGGGETVYDQGFRIQTGVFLVADLIEIAGRWAYILYDTSPEAVGAEEVLIDTSFELTPGINIYFSKNNNWKVQLGYSFIYNTFTQGVPDEDQKVLRIQFQAYF
jgi:phosphate-selective porin OprO and OprP